MARVRKKSSEVPFEIRRSSLGGKARAAKLSKKRRSEIARQAVLARWAKLNQKQRSELMRRIRAGGKQTSA